MSAREHMRLLTELEERKEQLQKELGDEFLQSAIDESELFADDEYKQILDKLHQQMGITEAASHVKRRLVSPWLAAASLVLCLGLAAHLFLRRSTPQEIRGQSYAAIDTITARNSKDRDQRMVLPDGSKVILSPGSTLSYTTLFGQKERKLVLSGRARFQVVRDTLLPFVVWANAYTTTALGTEFIVDTYTKEMLKVTLLSGKVVVKATAESFKTIDDQYLMPGDELHVGSNSIKLHRNPSGQGGPRPEFTGDKARELVPDASVPILRFDNAPLEKVFVSLSEQKNIHILFDQADLHGLTFTGEFTDEDSLQVVLQIICRMNNLLYEESEQGIHIRKGHKELEKNNQY